LICLLFIRGLPTVNSNQKIPDLWHVSYSHNISTVTLFEGKFWHQVK
jgi:hypothetical protein